MVEFVGQAGILILASHSASLLQENCTRGLWLDDGQLRFDGPIEEVLKAYEQDGNRLVGAAARA
mgnify:FL=1